MNIAIDELEGCHEKEGEGGKGLKVGGRSAETRRDEGQRGRARRARTSECE
jgi:hypothetical protein